MEQGHVGSRRICLRVGLPVLTETMQSQLASKQVLQAAGIESKGGTYVGTNLYSTGDMFCGVIDVSGRPAGRGILYYFGSGECDVATFDSTLIQIGEGVRFAKDRDLAYRLFNGQLEGGSLDLDEALEISGLQETPALRSADSIPVCSGFDPARYKQTKAWFAYRKLSGLTMEQPAGPSPYLPIWR
ncbi:hypothetical protein AK812_SmicGene32644 [Symbiodinium microadriaticum]|uniref:Uncharacterized protein n=1 Tax=Symbiodinium microadriaticum TaxID=2951 RepID=A0A1Q9CTK6_SYMMI|nr:hypothetical protein AK812_SmicGene32644 [Symbiodinium microadriaticum]CAE7033904.1 unnamed protein product [Symbiodinium sp. KB8]CAE7234627.1 unnamed protein product [Symbiodinium microadriaticum]